MNIILLIIQALLIPLISPMVIGLVCKVKAFLQNRRGASVLQPYYDLYKQFHKDEVISTDASWIFLTAPFIIFSISLVLAFAAPVFFAETSIPLLGDFLVIIYLIALMTFFLALGGLDVGSPFGGLGSSREMTVTAITEGAFVFSLLPAVLATNSTSIPMISSLILSFSLQQYFPLLIAIPTFVLVMLAETKRFPFDNPATHLELTMIHEAMILEYSGKRLGLLEWASYNKFLFFVILGIDVFFPWGLSTTITFTGVLFAIVVLAFKVIIVAGGVGALESTIAKYRFFRLPDILLTALIIGIIAILVGNH